MVRAVITSPGATSHHGFPLNYLLVCHVEFCRELVLQVVQLLLQMVPLLLQRQALDLKLLSHFLGRGETSAVRQHVGL